MKILATLLAATALAACSSEPAPEPTPEATETAAAQSAAEPGTYDVTRADGTRYITTINADGTFSTIENGKEAVTGKVEVVDGRSCFTRDEAGAKAVCYTRGSDNPDGTFSTTPDGEPPVIVKKTA
jgi:hypothetical protein